MINVEASDSSGLTLGERARIELSAIILPNGFVLGDVIAQAVQAAGFWSPAEVVEIDRNARAYGWSVGRGHPLAAQIEDVNPDNPFLDPNWRTIGDLA